MSEMIIQNGVMVSIYSEEKEYDRMYNVHNNVGSKP